MHLLSCLVPTLLLLILTAGKFSASAVLSPLRKAAVGIATQAEPTLGSLESENVA